MHDLLTLCTFGWLPALFLFLARELWLQRRDEERAAWDELARRNR